MLTLNDITFTLEGRRLFDGASATIPAGHKVGFVGRNGAGKTTLFRLIRGQWALDGGEIGIPARARVGGVDQEVPGSQDSLIDIVLAADLERARLMAEAETATDPNRIAEIQVRLTDIDAHSAEARAASILHGLGFDAVAQRRAAADFSGGWRMRVALAAVLFSAPDLLLLDEPTNYLDLEGAVWLESYIARYPHTAVIISHDRGLLDRSVNAILHLDQQKLTLYTGGYETFARQRAARMAEQDAQRRKQEDARAHMQAFVDRFRAKASKAKQAQSRLKMLERMEPVAATIEARVARFTFPNPEPLSPPIIRLDGTSVGYGDTTILKSLDLRIDEDDRIALLGANGQGKSTLSKLLAERLEPQSGDVTRARKLRVGFFAQHQLDELHADQTPFLHIRALRPLEPVSKIRARLAAGGIHNDIADTEVARLSGGQKARLAMMIAAIDAPHLLILDEPTNHLDIESRAALVEALGAFEGAVILVSHDPDLVNAVADQLWLVKDGTVRRFDGDMEEYKRLLLSERGSGGSKAAKEPEVKKEARKANADRRKILAPLRAELAKAEDRVAKLEQMRDRIDLRLADPVLYKSADGAELEELQKKRGEILTALTRAEKIWEQVQTKLEKAERG
ncbi:ATP-binding cassette subfamily F protein 3 [Rubricella aquisinus]|uniref:ATP-binding cassette subfamily F protein 3 n=1 Tax=Rubricella aquisinus TaxID=2028108 RepID=A0A840WX53_9RHOB|nr:ABC-F family ATP-binding cassette domain-containing protein [Rubricella aquisinus]MBB5514924.1 ATP-binding cassette subfamily F protein 3 [Rubricella aquisinus]